MCIADGPRRQSWFPNARPLMDYNTLLRQALSVTLSISVTLSVIGLDGCKKAEQPQAGQQAQQGQVPATTDAVPTAEQLYQLVAPIALFPDNLLAQVLAASTYPNEVSAAYTWVQQNSSLKGQQLMQAANDQSWDPSVKGLTQFPDVLNQMATNLSWTSALGDAYFNYPQSVMNAVQVMRGRAQQSGNLKSTQQQTVTVQNEAPGAAPAPPAAEGAAASQPTVIVQPPAQTIIIQPAQPEVVYVPAYNPTVVYGAPVATYPGYSTGDMVATSLISFGVGIAVGAAISGGGGCCGWGWNSWGCGWHNNTVVYNHNTYISNSNTFVNRNNYYRNANYNNANLNNINRNNINTNNINRNNINRNNINRNNINTNNINRNNVNANNRANNFNGDYSTPHFNQKYEAPQYRDSNAQNNRQNLGGQQGRGQQPNFNQNHGNQNLGAQNRQQGQQNWRNDGSRGYGENQNRGASKNAFGDYGQGGNARMNSARGQQSLQGRSGGFEGNRGGGNRGGGERGGGGRR
jgi:hypothetical protein